MAATVLVLASFATAGVAQAATTTCAQQATIAGGDYKIQTNEWNSGLQQCITTSGTAWSVTTAAYDVAYDLWFNNAPTTSAQPNGTEVMIWRSSRGGVQPFGSQTATASIAGLHWNVWTGQQAAWKIVSYVLSPAGTSFVFTSSPMGVAVGPHPPTGVKLEVGDVGRVGE